ncbi:hypothetical protein BJF79_24920 [Actinomadura sp. CNU-125]|nr:hypothetical protein BJF79_24920 [Actinomadura sp. CNU-125]
MTTCTASTPPEPGTAVAGPLPDAAPSSGRPAPSGPDPAPVVPFADASPAEPGAAARPSRRPAPFGPGPVPFAGAVAGSSGASR